MTSVGVALLSFVDLCLVCHFRIPAFKSLVQTALLYTYVYGFKITGSNYLNCTLAWTEQRQFLQIALGALQDHPLSQIISYLITQMAPMIPDVSDYQQVNISMAVNKEFVCTQGMKIGFNMDGSISTLYDPFNKIDWAGNGKNKMGAILYNTYNESDFDYMASLYNYYGGAGYDKPNSTKNANPESKLWNTRLNKMWRLDQDSCDFVLELVMDNFTANTSYGAPEIVRITYKERQSDGNSPAGFEASVLLYNKTATRLAESVTYYFGPSKPSGTKHKWFLSKVGHLIDPTNVVQNGSQYVHAVDTGTFFIDQSGNGLQITSQDVPLVLIGTESKDPSPFPVPLSPIKDDDINGLGFNIYNNIWNTNYIFWYPYVSGKDALYVNSRYSINFMKR